MPEIQKEVYMLVRVQRNQIHHFKEPILGATGNPTGGEKDVLQLDVQFPEYPELPTYGLRINYPISKPKVLAAIKVKAQEAKTQMEADEAIRSQLGAEVLEFKIEV